MNTGTVVTFKLRNPTVNYSGVGIIVQVNGQSATVITGSLSIEKANENPNDYEWKEFFTNELTEVAPSIVKALNL